MKSINIFRLSSLVLLAPFAPLAYADHGRFLALPMKKERASTPKNILKREVEVTSHVGYDNSSYLVNVDIGTPKQTVGLRVDVSTHQTWVISGCDGLWFHEDACQKAGSYNDSLSESNTYISTSYADRDLDNDDGSSYELVYYADDFTIQGGETLKNITFGVFTFPKSEQYGVLGLGFGKGVNTENMSIIDELVDQDIIEARAFSLASGPYGSAEGLLILGGVDTKKFSGELERRPIVDPPEFTFEFNQTQYWIDIDEVTTTGSDGESKTLPGFKVMQHTDIETSWLPPDLVDAIVPSFNVTVEDNYDWYLVHCGYKEIEGTLDLKFGGLTLSVPYGDLVLQGDVTDRRVDECFLSIMPRNVTEEGAIFWLGQNILGHLYTVYDQESRAVWLAGYEDCGTEIVGITQDENSIADIRGQCENSGKTHTEGSDKEQAGANTENIGERLSAPPVALWLVGIAASLLWGL